MFDENSGLVIVWVRLIKNKKKTINDIPNIDNLREVVLRVLDIQP